MSLKKYVLFAFAAAFMLTASLAAQAGEGLDIVVVDVQNLLKKSKAAQNIQKQLEKQRDKFQDEFSSHEKKLKEAEQELIKQKSVLSAEAFVDRRKAFEKQLIETQKLVQKRKRALDKAFARTLTELRNEILKIVADISDEEDIELVISSQNVVIGKKSIDITDKVLERLNKKVKKIKLDVRKEDEEG